MLWFDFYIWFPALYVSFLNLCALYIYFNENWFHWQLSVQQLFLFSGKIQAFNIFFFLFFNMPSVGIAKFPALPFFLINGNSGGDFADAFVCQNSGKFYSTLKWQELADQFVCQISIKFYPTLFWPGLGDQFLRRNSTKFYSTLFWPGLADQLVC